MANLEHLSSIIYHEKQESGSMLCAQHALNSLLQGNYFTAADLSHIAQDLDDLENSYQDEVMTSASRNMDDTGFFSVQVLERALSVWGLSLVRWRSEQMRPFQNHPHTQLGFILNLEQHWFTLRRFGHAESDISLDPGEGHWFNLNSFLDAPQWVSKTYLGMVLHQAEEEGYSVFAVIQADQTAPLGLPRTHADEVASFPEPTDTAPPDVQASISRDPSVVTSSSQRPSMERVEGVEDEDYELQAVLQASLMDSSHDVTFFHNDPPSVPPRLTRATVPLPSETDPVATSRRPQSGTDMPALPSITPSGVLNIPGHADVDPVEASRERNLVMLRRMREQQELAHRELFEDPEDAAAFERRREERRRQEEEEDEDLRRAIAESEALARGGNGTPNRTEAEGVEHEPWSGGPHEFSGARVYDDEDAEFQAALKASLESAPEGYQHPPSPRPSTNPTSIPAPSTAPIAPTEPGVADDQHETESVLSESTTTDAPSEAAPTNQQPDIDEIRKARLARFGL